MPALHDDLDNRNSAPRREMNSLPLSARGDPENEARLIARMALGEARALDELYGLYSDALFSLAVRMTGEARDAEEVLQDVFVRLWKSARAFDPSRSKPFTWAVMITRSLCIDRLRRREVRRRVLDQLRTHAGDDERVAAEDGVREVLFKETVDAVRRAMQRLTDNERRCVEAAVFDSAGSAELSLLMNAPSGTVKSWLHRGLIKLRTYLHDEPPHA